MNNFRISILDKGKYIGVTNPKGDLICCSSFIIEENDIILTSLTGSGNGDSIVFLLEYLKKEYKVNIIKIKSNSLLAVMPSALDKIKRDNLLQVIP